MESNVTPVLVGQGLQFAEGVNFDRDGTLYCVDVTGGAICRKLPGGELAVWAPTGGEPNGSRFGPSGDLFVADRGHKAILRLSTATGRRTTYADRWEGQPFKGPNDLCFGPDGTLYFTDPVDSTFEAPIGGVYAVAPDGVVARVATGLVFPNGLAVTPDGDTLVVAETHTGVLHRYSLAPSRRFEEVDPLVTLSPASLPPDEAGPDGMAFGADGNLYQAHFGTGLVRAIAPDGSTVTSIPAGGPTPTNVAFWEDSLYVTEGVSGSIYRLDIGVREQRPFMRPW